MKRALTLVAMSLVLAACSSSAPGKTSTSRKGPGYIAVDAASSLTEAFDIVKAGFLAAHPGTTIRMQYGASSDFVTQIAEGAPVDVFASASIKNMDALGDDAIDPANFAANTLAIAVPPGNPANVQSIEDLAKPGVKVAVCDPAVPCGAVTAQVFENAKITVHPRASLADVKSTLAAVESGEVDAGLVYVTDVRAAEHSVEGIAIPSELNASTTYPIAVLKHAQNPTLANAFVAYVLSPAGQKVLRAAGFLPP